MTSYFPNLLVPDTALSVAGVTAYIQALLEQDPQLQQIWVTGEVSSATQYRSGLFFTLQDPDAKASISCVVWKSQLSKLAALPTQGEQLIILGRVHVHAQRGQYQLVVWQALPAGEGLRALRYRQLRHRLEAEGLFDPERKRALPPHPQVIAVVTSSRAAAWGDIQRTLKRRYPGLRVLLSPALVQGDQAPDSIVTAIQRVAQDGRAEVLILSRGGGAIEDMACFNDERVVRAIASCPIPVISGIGHQRDESLADLVADVCAHTPTAAAELVVPELSALYIEHQERVLQLQDAAQSDLESRQMQLGQLKKHLQRMPIQRQLQRELQAIQRLRRRILQASSHQLTQATRHCQFLRQKLATLDPAEVLRRGYAVARTQEGTIVRTTQELSVGETLTLQLSQGQVNVKITEISS